MLVKINKVNVAGDVIDTREESFSHALALTEEYVKKSRTGVQLVNDNDLNQGWMIDVVSLQGTQITYDFQPITR